VKLAVAYRTDGPRADVRMTSRTSTALNFCRRAAHRSHSRINRAGISYIQASWQARWSRFNGDGRMYFMAVDGLDADVDPVRRVGGVNDGNYDEDATKNRHGRQTGGDSYILIGRSLWSGLGGCQLFTSTKKHDTSIAELQQQQRHHHRRLHDTTHTHQL